MKPDSEESAEEMILDRLEGVGRGIPIVNPPLPFLAVPTTAGTGAEAHETQFFHVQSEI